MHKGKEYPFHWYYWGTECFFWPGYVPWQMLLTPVTASPAPWQGVWQSTPRVFREGEYVADKTQFWWEVVLDHSPLWPFLRISVEQEVFAGQTYAVWKAVLFNLFTTGAEAWYFQPSPLYFTRVINSQWWTAHDPATPQNGPYIAFRPAAWHEITSQPHP
jgi:hypothetical protein